MDETYLLLVPHIRDWWIDTVVLLALNDQFRMYVPVVLLYAAWMWPSGVATGRIWFAMRSITGIICGLCVCLVGRHLLPQSPRPRLVMPNEFFGAAACVPDLSNFHSFPSDSATFAAGVATVIFYMSWRLGIVALTWAIVVVCLPRLYIGYHYPSDILAGLAIGCSVALLCMRFPLTGRFIEVRVEHWANAHQLATSLVLFGIARELIGVFPMLQFIVASVKSLHIIGP